MVWTAEAHKIPIKQDRGKRNPVIQVFFFSLTVRKWYTPAVWCYFILVCLSFKAFCFWYQVYYPYEIHSLQIQHQILYSPFLGCYVLTCYLQSLHQWSLFHFMQINPNLVHVSFKQKWPYKITCLEYWFILE